MKRLAVVGHSVIHPRQYWLFEQLGQLNECDIKVYAPSWWHDEHAPERHTNRNFELVPLDCIGQSLYNFRLRGLEAALTSYKPDLIYLMEEPHTKLGYDIFQIASELSTPVAVFTWENTMRKFGQPYDDIGIAVLAEARLVVAGNQGAHDRVVALGVAPEHVAICPQTGIYTDWFQPLETPKTFDIGYVGRMVPEKGLAFIETAARELNLKMRWVGARGTYKPRYGQWDSSWVLNYSSLPAVYNSLKLFVTFPYSLNGYQEQFNYSIAEAMSCGVPVITSDNGSIPDAYSDATITILHEGMTDHLKTAIAYELENLDSGWGQLEREWVEHHLSLDVIAKQLYHCFEAASLI